jgi:mono/diheme cytochrome c family protein
MKKIIVIAGSVFWLLVSGGLFAADWTSLEKNTGSGLYQEKCGMCHRDGGMGTGILARRLPAELAQLENREDLQSVFIETVVRNGFGIMFPMSRGEVSDAQLETIIDYLAVADQ